MVHPRPLRPAADVCWKCQWRIANQHRAIARVSQRALHATQSVAPSPRVALPGVDPSMLLASQATLPIREQLRRWQHDFGGPDEESLQAFEKHPARGDIQNNISKLSYSSKADEELRDDEWELNEDSEGEELITIGLFLKPGDVVELSQPGREPVLAVFVQQLESISQFYSVNGRWCHSQLATISFAVTACVDPALLQPLIPFMPTKPAEAAPKDPIQAPRDLGAPVQAILRQLTEESERIYRTNAPILDTAYSVLADSSRTRMMTLAQIAKTLLAKNDPTWSPSPSALLAVRKALNHDGFRFRSDDRSQRLTNVFAIRPKDDVDVVETVQEWVREYTEQAASLVNASYNSIPNRSKGATNVADFVEKARRLIVLSRKHRHPNYGFVGPSDTRFPLTHQESAMRVTWGEEFTTTDRQIINFMQAWVLTMQFKNMPNLHAACTSILHATGLYDNAVTTRGVLSRITMGRPTGQLFLQEIGVITPHENRAIYNEQLMLPTVRRSRNLELLNNKAELTRRNPDFRDSMADVRRDWGSTTVYCIDAASAKEIDDGISIERVVGKDFEYWVHVHIANPTAFFDKTHVLSGLAAHMAETVYTPERAFPMLPDWATQGYFSLGANRPAITFSSLVDASGNILETRIQHGIIRNVLKITPTELSAYLDENSESGKVKMVVGDEVPSVDANRERPQLSPSQLQNLRDLYGVAKALWEGRKAAGGTRIGQASNSIRLFENSRQSGLTWTPPSVDRARLVQGDPTIELTATIPKGIIQERISSSNIVEEMMMLACRSAGAWCAERNIPVMFRGTVESPMQSVSLEQFQKTVVLPHLEKNGVLSPGIGFRYIDALGRAIAHSAPLSHRTIGTPNYVKVTSPLRRFSDMIAHWQIEAALRYEARSGQKLNSTLLTNASQTILPFSHRQMQESIITLSPREKAIQATQTHSVHFWTMQAFMRAFYYKEAPLPDTFKVWVRRTSSRDHGTIGYMGDLSIRVNLLPGPGIAYQVGDQWEVKISVVDVFSGSVFVVPLELLHRDAELS